MVEYENYRGVIVARAKSWHLTTGLDIKECISIANLGFAEARVGFDNEKAKFITYLWPAIDGQFKIYLAKNGVWANTELRHNLNEFVSVNGALRNFRDKVLSLSGRAQMVIDDVLGNTDEYLVQRTKSGHKYGRHDRLVKRVASLGYPWETARGIVNEITQMLQEG